jgi:murein DD-endopeptidase MepM/ murein hydrolase activator NlpD
MNRVFELKWRAAESSSLFRKSLTFAVAIMLSAVNALEGQAFAEEADAWKDVVPGATLGSYRHGTYPSWGNRTHAGIDLLAECGTPVRAYQEGTVTDVVGTGSDRDFRTLGYMVIIEHPEDLTGRKLYTLYLHMAAPPGVKKGKRVAGGDKIGLVGTTGAANDVCHTHFEIRYFPGRFSAWGNIYGSGDKRNDAYFRQQWENPLQFNISLEAISADSNEDIRVASPVLPESIASFIASRGLRMPVTISKYCGFDFKTGGNPFFISGDFDGDGRLDYAIDVEEKTTNVGRIFVFLGNGRIHELQGWEYIYTDKDRGTFQTFDGINVNQKYDSIGGVACEKSSVVYVYNKTKNGFDEFFTGD